MVGSFNPISGYGYGMGNPYGVGFTSIAPAGSAMAPNPRLDMYNTVGLPAPVVETSNVKQAVGGISILGILGLASAALLKWCKN